MKRSPARAVLAGATLLALGAAALAQQRSPESLLPPGFGDPAPPAAAPPPPPRPATGDDLPVIPLNVPLASTGDEPMSLDDVLAAEVPERSPEQEALATYDLPEHARRPADRVGPYTGAPGLGEAAFGAANGRFLTTLIRRLDAPIASRWASMLLRRALLTNVPTPRGVAAPDWVAERAWLLLRMGEADAARMLVDSMDIDAQSPKLLAVTAQVALANGNPVALCPLVDLGEASSKEPLWPLARAMCAALSGDDGGAASLLARARQKRLARGVDLRLAEKVAGAGTPRRVDSIVWDPVDQLTSWRFGLATATGVAIPDRLLGTVGPHVLAWRARSPMVPMEERIGAARTAAALGVFSNAVFVDLYGAIADRTDPADLAASPAGRLRAAYLGDSAARVTAMRGFWTEAAGARDRYATDVLIARAAARIAPAQDHDDDLDMLIGAMFSAGFDRAAVRWGSIAEAAGERSDAWGMIAVGAPEPVNVDATRAADWAKAARGERAAKGPLLVAALAGLGRLPAANAAEMAQVAGFSLDASDRWARTIELAVRAGQPGTVALLAAAAMQTSDWRGVPPAHFYRLISALRRVGLEGEARMIAAEAITRA